MADDASLAFPVPSGVDDTPASEMSEAGLSTIPPGGPASPPGDHADDLTRWAAMPNIAEDLDDTVLSAMGQAVLREYDIDQLSRSDWQTNIEDTLKLATQKAEEKLYPWPRAANIVFPVITTAAIQFAARAYPAIVSGRGVVKGAVTGDDSGKALVNPMSGQPMIGPAGPLWIVKPGAKAELASKIAGHMSWQLIEEMEEWESDTDTLLHVLPIVGCEFRKTFYDPGLRRNLSLRVSAVNVVIHYYAKSLELAPRITERIELYPYEIEEKVRGGLFSDHEYGPANPSDERGQPREGAMQGDDDAPHLFLEQHRRWDLDDDGYPEPYVITVHKASGFVARVVARYDPGSIKRGQDGRIIQIEPIQHYTKYDFLPNPDGGVYGFGFAHYLRPINEGINTTLNQMIDAGHLANAGGGFIANGLSMKSGNVRFQVGEYKVVTAKGIDLRAAVYPLPFPGPSPVLFQLLGLLIDAAKDVASVKDVLVGDQPNANVPATTTLALIEQGLKVFTAIYKRVFRSLKKELNKLKDLNAKYLPEQGAAYQKDGEWVSITRNDYRPGIGVSPIADPAMVSDMQRLGKAQLLQGMRADPLINPMEVLKRILEAANIEQSEKLIVPPQPQPPNPELLEKMAELKIKQNRERAGEIKDLSQAILNLANAKKAADEGDLAWYEHQLEIMRFHVESATQALGGSGGAGADGSPIQPLEAPPGNGQVPPLPGGLQGPAPQGGPGLA